MPSQHKRQMPLLLASLGTTLLAVASAMAAEPTSGPASAPNSAPAVDQHGPNIKEAYKDHFLIGMAGDLPGKGVEEFEVDLTRGISKSGSSNLDHYSFVLCLHIEI